MTEAEMYEECAVLWTQSNDYERVISLLRSFEVSKLDTIKAIRNICGASLGDAKKIVNASTTWADTVDGTAHFHDILEKGAISEQIETPVNDAESDRA